jgi:hypothetical protein
MIFIGEALQSVYGTIRRGVRRSKHDQPFNVEINSVVAVQVKDGRVEMVATLMEHSNMVKYPLEYGVVSGDSKIAKHCTVVFRDSLFAVFTSPQRQQNHMHGKIADGVSVDNLMDVMESIVLHWVDNGAVPTPEQEKCWSVYFKLRALADGTNRKGEEAAARGKAAIMLRKLVATIPPVANGVKEFAPGSAYVDTKPSLRHRAKRNW